MKGCCRANQSVCASSQQLWSCENAPTEKPSATDQSSLCRAHRPCFPGRRRTHHLHKDAAPRRSARWQNRDKSSSRVSRWHRPDCSVRRVLECRDDRVWILAHASKPRCHAGFHGRSVVRKPCTETDPDAKKFWWDSSTDTAPRTDEKCAAAENP